MTIDSQAPAPAAQGSEPPESQARGYREEQGRLARMFAFWACVLLLLFGCSFLHGILVQFSSLRTPLGGIRIPVVGVDLSTAFLIALAVFVVGVIAIQRWQAKPRTADLLIETEAELRKVTWPGLQEVINTSIVVVLCVLILFALLAAADWFLARVMRYLLLGEA